MAAFPLLRARKWHALGQKQLLYQFVAINARTLLPFIAHARLNDPFSSAISIVPYQCDSSAMFTIDQQRKMWIHFNFYLRSVLFMAVLHELTAQFFASSAVELCEVFQSTTYAAQVVLGFSLGRLLQRDWNERNCSALELNSARFLVWLKFCRLSYPLF